MWSIAKKYLISISGDTSCSETLRALTALELFEQAEEYAKHSILTRTLEEGLVFTDHEDTLFSLLLTEEPSDFFDQWRDRVAAVKEEAKLTCEEQRWSSLIHILALASILKLRMLSVYPNANQGLRPLFHRIINPLSEVSDGEKPEELGILWSRDGNLDIRCGVSFEPNHFVLLLPQVIQPNPNESWDSNVDCDYEFSKESASSAECNQVDDDGQTGYQPQNNQTEPPSASDGSKLASSGIDVGGLLDNDRVLTDQERYTYLKNHFIPSKSYPGLTTQTITKGARKQRYTLKFQTSWLDKYPWLVFSPCQKGGLCKFCILFPPNTGRVKNAVFVSRPLVKLSKASGKDGYLENHAGCSYHKEAVLRGTNFLENYTEPSKGIKYKILETNKKTLEENRHIVACIMKAIHLCGKQGIALRGHRDDCTTETGNKGNFLAILNLMAENDSVLRNHLADARRNAKYTSKTVQNEIIQIIGDFIRDVITRDLRDSDTPFSLIADEVTDISNKRNFVTMRQIRFSISRSKNQ